MIDVEALAMESTYEGGNQIYVELVDTIAQAIDPVLFARLDPDVMVAADDREWLYGKADGVLDALNSRGFLAVPSLGADND